MEFPFIGKKEEKEQENFNQTLDQQSMSSLEGIPHGLNPAEWNYYLAIQNYKEEMSALKGFLEGSIPIGSNEDGLTIWGYPKERIRYIQVQNEDGTNKYILEEAFDKIKHVPTGKIRVYEREIKNPVCSPEGMTKILNFCDMRLKPGTAMSNFTMDRIITLLQADSVILQEMISINMDNWKINPTQYKSIIRNIMNRIETCMRRAENGEERKLITASTTINLQGNSQQGGQKKGLLSGLFSSSTY